MAKPDQKKNKNNKTATPKVTRVKNPPVIFPKAAKPKDTSKDPVQLPSMLFASNGVVCVRAPRDRYPNGLSNAWRDYSERAIMDRWSGWSHEARQPIVLWAEKLANSTESERSLFGAQMTKGVPKSRQNFWRLASEILSLPDMDTSVGYEHLTKMFKTFGTGDANVFTGLVIDMQSKVKEEAMKQIAYGEVDGENNPQTYICVATFDHTKVVAEMVNTRLNPPKPGFPAPAVEIWQERASVMNSGFTLEFFSTKECILRGWKVADFAHRDRYFWINYKG